MILHFRFHGFAVRKQSRPPALLLSVSIHQGQAWRTAQSHSCCLEGGVSFPSGWMFLLGPLTLTECTRPDTLGLPRAQVPVHFCLYRRVFLLNRGGVDCQCTDRLRHSHNTLMVIVVITGRKSAGLMAWHASCLPLSELRAVTLWEKGRIKKAVHTEPNILLKLKTSHHSFIWPEGTENK